MLAAEVQGPFPVCDRCARVPTLGESYVVRTAGGSITLDGASILARLRTGQIAGTDWMGAEGEAPVPIASHPVFAPLYARGEIVVVEPPPVPVVAPARPAASARRRGPGLPWGRMVATTLGLGALGVAGWQAWTWREQLRSASLDLSQVFVPEAPGARPSEPESAPPEVLTGTVAFATLIAEVGPVEEPLAQLESQAVAAWATGTPAGAAEARRLARRAVARSPEDADAIALLAVLDALGGADPAEAHAAGKLAVTLGKGGVATEMGRAALALSSEDRPAAAAAVATCVAAGDGLCREIAARSAATPAAQVAALDAVAADWPENVGLSRRAAELAAAADLPDAAARLEAIPDPDAALRAARALLHVRDGEPDKALALSAKLGEDTSSELRVALARIRVAQGRPADAEAILVPLVGPENKGETLGPALLLSAQARWLVARDDAEKVEVAAAAVARVMELGRVDPAVAQVRALVAHARGDRAEAARAWTAMDTSRRDGAELSRALQTQVALMADGHVAGSEILPVAEAAREADPSDPDVHVWLIHVHLLGKSPALAVEAMRTAVRQVDGQVERRRGDLATLDTGSPARGLGADLKAALGNDATFTISQPLALGGAAWLAGDLKGARAVLASAPHLDSDADALALRARVGTALGDTAGALADWEKVVAARPKQPEYLLGLLRARIDAGKAAQSGPLAEQVAASRITGPIAHATLAEVYAATGRNDLAIGELERCLEGDPFDVQARRRLRALRSAR